MNSRYQRIKSLIGKVIEEATTAGVKVPVATAIKMNPAALGKIAQTADVTITDGVNESVGNILPPYSVDPGTMIYNDGEPIGPAVQVNQIDEFFNLYQYDDQNFLPDVNDDNAMEAFRDKFSPDDFFVVVKVGNEHVIGYYGPHDFYAIKGGGPGGRAPSDTENKPNQGNSGDLSQAINEAIDRVYKEQFIATKAYALTREDNAKYQLADLTPDEVLEKLQTMSNEDINYLYDKLKTGTTTDLDNRLN